jgi:ABC-2 type transport system ATP-binding protein
MLVELQSVAKRFGPITALHALNGQIDGSRVGLLGPNGAGKSTLLKLLLGLIPFEGTARVLGMDPRVDTFRIRDRVGYMPESESHLAGMNAVEMCVYAGELSGLPRSAAMQRAHAALYHVNLEDKRYMKVEGYSTGMKQRVKLAQALVHDPELLFLDEPTNGLDPRGRDEMLELIAALPARRGCRVILSSHLLPDIERVCDKVMIMNEGHLLFFGTVAELRGEDAHGWLVRVKEIPGALEALAEKLRAAGGTVQLTDGGLTVSLPDGADTDAILRAARDAGAQIRHLAPQRATLEAAFLRAISSAGAAHP